MVKRQAVVSEEELQEKDITSKGEPVIIQLRDYLQFSGSLTSKGYSIFNKFIYSCSKLPWHDLACVCMLVFIFFYLIHSFSHSELIFIVFLFACGLREKFQTKRHGSPISATLHGFQ